MKPGRLLIAAILMAALGGAVWWSNKKTAADAAKPPADASPKILALNESNISQIEFKHPEGPPSIVKKNDAGNWQVTAPKTLPGDKYAIGNVTNLLSNLTSDRMVDDKVNPSDLAGYGLAPPVLEVDTTLKDGKTTKLLIGEQNATGSGVYAKVDGDSRLFLTATTNKGTLDKTYKDLQDRHLLNLDPDKVSRVELNAKNQSIEFGRAGGNDWQILKPKPMRADGSQVQDLVQKLRDGVFDTVSDEEEKKLPAEFAAAPLIASVKVTDANGTHTLEVHKAKDDYYGRSDLVPTPQKISHDLGSGLDKSLDDFRNKKLFDFGFSDPTKIEYKDGDKSVTYEKSGEKWVSAGKTIDSVSIQSLIDNLRDLSASKFVETGFTKPVVTMTVTSNDGKRTERVEIAPTSGANFIARRDGDSSLYELEVKNVQDLRKAASDVREAQPEPASQDKKK